MNDQEIMENLLMTTKGVCDLYMHGAIESATQDVHQAFGAALTDSLSMQDDIYQKMSVSSADTVSSFRIRYQTQNVVSSQFR